jgi:hypothetical protein
MKICAVCNSQQICNSKSDYCKDCEETLRNIYEQELDKEMKRTFKENAEAESGTIVRTYEEIFDLLKENVTDLVDGLKSSLEENLYIRNIKTFDFRDKLRDNLLKATYKKHRLLLRYKSSGICDSPSDIVDYNLEFLIDGVSEFYYQLTYTNGEYEFCDSSYFPVTQCELYADDEENFIGNIINKLEQL